MLYPCLRYLYPDSKRTVFQVQLPPISTATALALGAVASFNLVYPSPVIISAAEELSANRDMLILLGFLTAVPTSFQDIFMRGVLERLKFPE